jgi:hypothetical protein
MVRVRVYLRSGNGKKVPMLGYLLPASLVAIRDRFRAKAGPGGRRCHVTARLKQLDAMEVSTGTGGKTLPARKLLLGLTVREGPQRQQVLREGLGELFREAERIKEASQKLSVLSDQRSALESTKSA